jgi:hypothetical protein
MPSSSPQELLRDVIDLHVHTAPDVRPRQNDDLNLIRVFRRAKASALVLKSHHVPTADRAWWASHFAKGLKIFGSLTLNESVGGLNPAAVATALTLGARIIWLPTLSAANHHRHQGKSGGLSVARAGQITGVTAKILELIATHGAALATGHISHAEIHAVVPAAARAGIKRIIITHPEHRVTNLDIDDQRALLNLAPVYFERCSWQPAPSGGFQRNDAINLTAIRTLGPASTILSSDYGETFLPPWPVLFGGHLQFLIRHGVTRQELATMTQANPRYLLGLSGNSLRPPYSTK